jgi:hypothetical protein
MPAGISIPFRFTPDTIADADQVNADFDAVAAKFGLIVDGDCAPAMDLDGNKLSSTPAKQVPEVKLGTKAVSARVLANDSADPGSDASRAVSGDHIKTLTVAALARFLPALGITGSKLAAATLGLDKLKVTVHTVAFGPVSPSADNYATAVVTPSVSFPKATYELIALYAKNVTIVGSGTLHANDSGANWAGLAAVAAPGTGPGSFSGTAVFVFLSRA